MPDNLLDPKQGLEGVDDYNVDAALIHDMGLTYTGRDEAGNRVWTDNAGHRYNAAQLQAMSDNELSGSRTGSGQLPPAWQQYAGMPQGYMPGMLPQQFVPNMPGYNAAGGSGPQYPGMPQPLMPGVPPHQSRAHLNPVTDTLGVTNRLPALTGNPSAGPQSLLGEHAADLPHTAGKGRYSLQRIMDTIKANAAVRAAIAHGRPVVLVRSNTVNGKLVQSIDTVSDGLPGKEPMFVTFTGDFNIDGSQAAGKPAKFQFDCD